MNFETAADPSIRPTIGHQATAAHAVWKGNQVADASGQTGSSGPDRSNPEEDFSFYDLLDVINPLQHIPGVSHLYRELTGDEIKAPARILGGFLFGGPVGFVASAANAIVEESSGRDIGETALAMVFGSDEEPAPANSPAADLASGPETPSSPLGAPAALAAELAGPPQGQAPATASATAQAQSLQTQSLQATAPAAGGAPASTGQTLTGADALRALAADLRGQSSLAAASATPASAAIQAPPPAARDGNAPASASATAGAALAETAYAEGREAVPANLVNLGSRDRRGLAPVVLRMPQQNAIEASVNGTGHRARQAGLGPAEERSAGQAAEKPAAVRGGTQANLISYDPTLFSVDASQSGGLSAPAMMPGALGPAAGQDFSGQMLEALKKYEHMLQDRKAPAAS